MKTQEIVGIMRSQGYTHPQDMFRKPSPTVHIVSPSGRVGGLDTHFAILAQGDGVVVPVGMPEVVVNLEGME